MRFILKKTKNLNDILQRSDMRNEEFLYKLQLSGELALKIVNCVRIELGKAFRLPPEKLYPDDNFREIISLPCWEWDMIELVFALEEILKIGIDEEQVPDWTCKSITLGQWIVEFLCRNFPEHNNLKNREI
ncbi:hypothetical protein [Nostoc sp. PCC 7107]|uniref:hypothetical protein n=1 Tax=Nostoc sp. PCC 7107 TaxID=317936 RepID=UPI00029F1C0B|nr:hypothetical protein [Nostoc sp. PCC 7107]AFY40965.1 hypothetical protein Nos7107_0280 [Nostoc sp. PCC 7107]